MRIGVLISGGGTNLQALIDACADPAYPAEIAVVISNKADAYGLTRARDAGIPAVVVRGRTRRDADANVVATLREHGVDQVCLAGFMRLVTDVLLDAFPQRVMNIHPALLPSFPGLHGQEQALEYGVRIAGATVHFVDTGTDTGPIIVQGAVPVLPSDDADVLKARILTMEHRLYPLAVRWAAEGRVRVDGRSVNIDGVERPFLFDV